MKAENKTLIVWPDEKKTVSAGGIIIPEKAQDPPISGTIALTYDDEAFPVQTKVWYPNYCIRPLELEINGIKGTYHVIPAEEVFISDASST